MKVDYAGIVASGHLYPIIQGAMFVPKYETKVTYEGRVVEGVGREGDSYWMIYEDDTRSESFSLSDLVDLDIYQRQWVKVA